VDNDGVNPLDNNENETYVGGASVGSWETISMTEKVMPTTNITNDPEIDFFILPDHIANMYYGKIEGLSEVLVDYYVEITDNNGNVTKSKIQHVWVGENLNINPTITFDPETNYSPDPIDVTITATDTTDPNPALYYTTDGTDPTISSPSATSSVEINITETTTFKVFAVDNEDNASDIVSKTYTIGSIPDITVYFKPGNDWTVTPKIYWWNAEPMGTLADQTWPGIDMQVHDADWYKHTFSGVTQINVIFNNGSGGNGNQTEDIIGVTEDIWYEWGAGIVLSTDDAAQQNVRIYPNPAIDLIRIDAAVNVDSYQIFDTLGKEIQQGKILNNEIDVTLLKKGMYILKLNNDSGLKKTVKFVK
jgi:hypothetical protein